MIKKWTGFNESFKKVDDITTEELSSFVKKVREAFIEFEDDDSIEYQFFVSSKRSESNVWIYAKPNVTNFDNWIEKIKIQIEYSLLPSYSNKIGLNVNLKLKDKTSALGLGGAILNENGIDKLEDIIIAKNRIKEHFDEVYLSFLGNHQDYVPVTFKVIYNR